MWVMRKRMRPMGHKEEDWPEIWEVGYYMPNPGSTHPNLFETVYSYSAVEPTDTNRPWARVDLVTPHPKDRAAAQVHYLNGGPAGEWPLLGRDPEYDEAEALVAKLPPGSGPPP